MIYQNNLPLWERIVRIGAGVLVAGFGYLAAPAPAIAWLAYGTGATLAGTGLIGFCPLCALAGRRLKRGG